MAHKKTTFTPGPWNYRPGTNPHYQGQISSEDTGATIAITYSDETGANAELIAQAPELFAALRQMVDDAEDCGKKTEFRGFVTQASINRAKRALLAADGGQR